jgi:hypothetical protein
MLLDYDFLPIEFSSITNIELFKNIEITFRDNRKFNSIVLIKIIENTFFFNFFSYFFK